MARILPLAALPLDHADRCPDVRLAGHARRLFEATPARRTPLLGPELVRDPVAPEPVGRGRRRGAGARLPQRRPGLLHLPCRRDSLRGVKLTAWEWVVGALSPSASRPRAATPAFARSGSTTSAHARDVARRVGRATPSDPGVPPEPLSRRSCPAATSPGPRVRSGAAGRAAWRRRGLRAARGWPSSGRAARCRARSRSWSR